MPTVRYAIYYTPPPFSRLAVFGASILGYDCYEGMEVAQVAPDGIDPVLLALMTAEPKRYGFHATIVAPFALGRYSEAELAEELATFARTYAPVLVGQLVVGRLASFAVLRPAVERDGISRFAEQCLEAFDRFRGPLSELDRARRTGASLTARQRALTERWGYPYVLDQYRFHMTLAGPVPDAQMDDVVSSLSEAYAELANDHFEIDALSLLRQDGRDQRFRVIQRYRLCGRRR